MARGISAFTHFTLSTDHPGLTVYGCPYCKFSVPLRSGSGTGNAFRRAGKGKAAVRAHVIARHPGEMAKPTASQAQSHPSAVRVLLFPVGGAPVERRVNDKSVKELQALVGGYFEMIRLDDVVMSARGLRLWCNEDGRLLKLPVNREVRISRAVGSGSILGPFFIARTDDGQLISLTDEDVSDARRFIDAPTSEKP